MLRKALAGMALVVALAPMASAETVDELIEKNIKARGGMEKLQSIQTRRLTGKMVMHEGLEAPIVILQKRPKAQRMEFTLQGLTGIQAYDGTNGWMVMPFMGKKDPELMSADDVKELEDDTDFDGPLVHCKEKGNKVELMGKEQVEGAEAYRLKVTLKSGEIRYIYLDAEYFLEIKHEGKRKFRGAEMDFESSIGDYKDEGGLMLAHSVQSGEKGSPNQRKFLIDRIELNPVLSDSLFNAPAGVKPAAVDSMKTASAAPDSGKLVAKPAVATKQPAAKPKKKK